MSLVLRNRFFFHDTHTLASRSDKGAGETLEHTRFVKIKLSLQIFSINDLTRYYNQLQNFHRNLDDLQQMNPLDSVISKISAEVISLMARTTGK